MVTFGDKNKGLTDEYGYLEAGNVIIDNISVVQGVKHNLVSISQLCDKGYIVLFEKEMCQILHKKKWQINNTSYDVSQKKKTGKA